MRAVNDEQSVIELPIISLANANASGSADVAAAFDRAFCDVGFCYIADTGVDWSIVNAAFAAAEQFHALPLSAKQEIAVNQYHRGYIASKSSLIKTSSVAKVTRPNLSESLMIMHEVADDDPRFGEPLQGPNQWPEALPDFRTTVSTYERELRTLALRLTRLLAQALGLRSTHLDPYFEQPTTWLRLLHYPPQDDTDAQQFGAAPHTDFGFLTILAQDSIGGLEVRTRSGDWLAATPIPETFVVNVADMLARWTNDRWTSTAHRVRNVNDVDRYSIPYFWDMSTGAEVECLPTCTDAGHPPKYPTVNFGDYVMERLNKNYRYRGAS